MGRSALPRGAARTAIFIGTLIPDAAYKSLHLIFQVPRDHAQVFDTPVGVAVTCYILCFLFEEYERRAAFGGLIFGGLLHLLLDSFKFHLGTGSIMVAFPLSWKAYGFEAYLPENTVYATFPAVTLALLWTYRDKLRKLGTGTK